MAGPDPRPPADPASGSASSRPVEVSVHTRELVSTLSRFDRAVLRCHAMPTPFAVATIAAILVSVWVLVEAFGGPPMPLVHLYYVAILLSATKFGLVGALATAGMVAVVSGPVSSAALRPITTDVLLGWGVRTVVLLFVGTVIALAFRGRDRAAQHQLSADVRSTLCRAGQRPAAADPELVLAVPDVLARRSFHPVYQPVYALDDGRLLMVEALTRFDAPQLATPDRWFVAAAEAGCGVELEIAAIEEALAGAESLPVHVEVALNASPQTLADPRLLDVVRTSSRSIVLEVTEHAAIADYPLLRSALEGLRATGVRIAVDDAGSGFASLQHIVQLSPAIIKLDIALAQDLAGSPLRRALAVSMVDFAHRIGAQLVVEGIEDETDLAEWCALGADAAQGFLLALPAPLPVPPSCDAVRAQRHLRPADVDFRRRTVS